MVKSVEIDLSVTGDTESKAKLDAIDARAEALKEAFPTYALKVDSAAATAKLQVFRGEFKSVADAAAKPMEMQVLSAKATKTIEDIRLRAEKLKATFPEFTAKIDDTEYKAKLAVMAAEAKATGDIISRELSGGGGGNLGGSAAGDAAAAGESGAGSIGPIPLPALLAIVPALGAALVEVTGLISGFAAAGAGAGAFALLAAPAVKKVETAYTALNTAQLAYQAAQAKENADPTKTNATALKNAALNLQLVKDQLKQMPQAEQGALGGIQNLVTEFGKMSAAFAPEAFKVFAAGLKLVGDLLPVITPFAKTFADVISGLLGKLDNALFTKQVTDVSRAVHGLAGSISSIAPSAGFQKFLDQFHSLEGPALTAIGDGIGKVVTAVGKLLTTMSAADVARTIGIAFNVIAGAINTVSYVVKTLMTNWDSMSATAKTATHDVASVFDAFRHDIAAVFSEIISNTTDTWNKIWTQTIGRVIQGAHSVEAAYNTMKAALSTALNAVSSAAVTAWNTIWNNTVTRVQNGITSVVNFFKGIPGKITSALGSAGSVLTSWGAGVINGLLSGMTSVISSVWNFIKGIPGQILKFLGIKSPPDWAIEAGKQIMNGLGIGMTQAQGVFQKASAASAAAAAKAVTGGGAVGAFAGQGGSNAANIALAKRMAAAAGWTGAEWTAMLAIIMQESGGSSTIKNPGSSASGIAQNIAGFGPGYEYGNAAQQIAWMINYIRGRYGDPISAEAFHLANGYYDRGGWLPTGLSLAMNNTGAPERVVSGSQDPMVAELRALRAEVRSLTGVAAAIPARTGQHVGGVINGAGADASFRRRYP